MVSHLGYLRKKKNLKLTLSQLMYTGEIPTGKTAKDELRAIRELIESVYKKRDIVKKIQFLNKKIDVTVNFDESHLKKILHFLQNQEDVRNKLTKIKLNQGLGKEIIEQYKIKINEIKYDPNEIKDVDKATNALNSNESQLKKNLHFLQNQEDVRNKLTKIKLNQGLGKEIIEQYKIKINEIKYDPNEIKDVDKATNALKEIEKEITPYLEKNEPKEIEIYNEPNFLYSYHKNYHTKMNKICKFLLNADKPVTLSQIEENVRFDKFTVQQMVYELFGKSLVIGVREIENQTNWFTYYWTAKLNLIHYAKELEALIQDEMKNEDKKLKILEEFNDSDMNKF